MRVTGPRDKRADALEVHQIGAVCPKEAARRKSALERRQCGAHRIRSVVGVDVAAAPLSLDEPDGLGRERLVVIADRNKYARGGHRGLH